jgi:predicted ribosomally synthesized peptide with nif11-like leader
LSSHFKKQLQDLKAISQEMDTGSGKEYRLHALGGLALQKFANEAGFDLNKEDWLKYQTSKTTELSDADLEVAAGGAGWLTQCGGSVKCDCVVSGDW